MEQLITIYLDNTTIKNKEYNGYSIEELRKLLEPLEVEVEYDEKRNMLHIDYDESKVFIKTNRMAGRKEKHYGKTPAEVRELIKENGCTKAAEILGMSKAMMYRRLNKAEKEGKIFI